MHTEQQVLAAAARLVEAFGKGELEAYFAAFAPDATFLFYTLPTPLLSREEYWQCWQGWQRDLDLRIVSCQSRHQVVRMLGDSALFMHEVTTEIATREGSTTLQERESILFRAEPGGAWLAWHEHLSPAA